MTQVYISDIWMDRAGKFWRIVLARAGDEMVTIGACGRSGRFAIGWPGDQSFRATGLSPSMSMWHTPISDTKKGPTLSDGATDRHRYFVVNSTRPREQSGCFTPCGLTAPARPDRTLPGRLASYLTRRRLFWGFVHQVDSNTLAFV